MDHRIFLLDLEALNTFVAVAETGNFSRAAEAISRAPSAVSMQIKKLEKQLKTSLFDRSPRKVAMTRDGEKLLEPARQMLALSKEAVARFFTPSISGVVRLGAPDDIAERIVPGVLRSIGAIHPEIQVDVVIATSESLLSRSRAGNLDAAIFNYARNAEQRPGELLTTESMVWAGARGGAAHRAAPLPLAVYDGTCIWKSAALDQLDSSGRSYRLAYVSCKTMMQKAAVEADLAVAPLPEGYLTDKMVVLGEVDGLRALPAFDIRLLVNPEVSEATQIVAEFLRTFFRN